MNPTECPIGSGGRRASRLHPMAKGPAYLAAAPYGGSGQRTSRPCPRRRRRRTRFPSMAHGKGGCCASRARPHSGAA
uniref:Uncharacterized protein n=1 Tax=Setaria viridis TaxID=4556 RepID=A0A4U6UJY1_SETVI|nr:hypothetical protein SEVIR_5G260566v2 [Setaria viridis]